MDSSARKNVLGHPFVIGALGLSVIIALGSFWYYRAQTRTPQTNVALTATSTAPILTTGTVAPAQNPNLAFVSGGRVARVNSAVGDRVGAGETLASLDIASLSAQRAQATANVAAAQAKLDALKAGPRSVDVAAKQTALDQANTTLQNLYASMPANITQAYDKSFSGISQATDNLFNQPNSTAPTLVFLTSNTQLANDAANQRIEVAVELAHWQQEISALGSGASNAQIDTALTQSLSHMKVLRTYNDTLLSALAAAVPSGSFPQSSIAASQTAVGALRDTINTQILSLQGLEQQIKTDELAVQSAQNALDELNAGATVQDIEAAQAAVLAAQAQVQNVDAQIHNALIVAPYSGVVSSVQVKVDDIVAPNTVAVTLNPLSSLQIVAYVSEADAGRIAPGEAADVTLDAYGSSRHFAATVTSVDQSPTMQSGVPAYRTVLQFQSPDPSISSGMTANVTITAAH